MRNTRLVWAGAFLILAWLGLPVYALFTGISGAFPWIFGITLVEVIVGLALGVAGTRRAY